MEHKKDFKKKILMPFFMLGQFDDETTIELINSAVRSGADYIELGIPHSDPLADGQLLRETAASAIQKGMTPKRAIELVGKIVQACHVPVYILTYLNTLFGYKVDVFIKEVQDAGVSGLIIPDLPIEAQAELKKEFDFGPLTLATFTSPTSTERLDRIAKESNGLVYAVNYSGITGHKSEHSSQENNLDQRVKENYKILSRMTDSLILSGFGIDSPESAKRAAQYADGVIIGTKICEICNAADRKDLFGELSTFVRRVRLALDENPTLEL